MCATRMKRKRKKAISIVVSFVLKIGPIDSLPFQGSFAIRPERQYIIVDIENYFSSLFYTFLYGNFIFQIFQLRMVTHTTYNWNIKWQKGAGMGLKLG